MGEQLAETGDVGTGFFVLAFSSRIILDEQAFGQLECKLLHITVGLCLCLPPVGRSCWRGGGACPKAFF